MHTSLLHDLHTEADAVLRPRDEAAPLLTYGDVPAEYTAAREGCVLFDETDRGRVRVSGADAREFLHRLLANEVLPLAPGDGNRNLLLTPKGKVRFTLHLCAEPDGSYTLGTEPGDAPRLCEALDMYLFTEDVTLEDQSEQTAPLTLLGPDAVRCAKESLGISPPRELYACVGNSPRVARVRVCGEEALRIDAGPEAAAETWQALVQGGTQPAGRVLADILRVEAVAAAPLQDVTDEIYPQEARLEDAFSLSKGCYIGQEVVAKIDTYGGLNKRLYALRVSDDDPVPAGTRLFRQDEETGEWRDLGVATSWGYSFRDDGGRVLAYLKRRHQEPGTEFRVGKGPATATVIDA